MRKWSRRNWKLKNPDKVKDQIFRYYHRYRDKILTKRKNNPAVKEYDRIRSLAKFRADPEGMNRKNRERYQKNKEKTIARTRRYKCQKNQEKMATELWQLALLVGSKLSGKK